MTKNKSKTKVMGTSVSEGSRASLATSLAIPVPSPIPMTSYISIVGVHTTLWGFCALYLPRTSLSSVIPVSATSSSYFSPIADPSQLTSLDRPQHPFLAALTLNPTWTLAWLNVGAAILQGWWGGWLRHWWYELGLRGSDAEKSAERSTIEKAKGKALLDACALTLLSSSIIHSILILFGSPITSHLQKTYLLALLISQMTLFCPAYVLGVPLVFGMEDPTFNSSSNVVRRWTWVRLFAELDSRNLVERALVYPAVGTVVGAWVGIIPIALDWDRPWQAWPLTPAYFGIVGYVLASMFGVTREALRQVAIEHTKLRAEREAGTSAQETKKSK